MGNIALYLRRFTNGTVNYVYKTINFEDFNPRFGSPITPMPLPEEDDDRQILTKVEGNSTVIGFTWIMKQSSVNLGSAHNGASDPGSTKNIWEQLLFWEDFMIGTGITASFDIVVADDAVVANLDEVVPDNILYQKSGFLTSFDPHLAGNSPVAFRTTVQLIVGDVITSYNTDTPSEVLNLAAVTGTLSGEIDVSWDDPVDNGGSAVTGHTIFFKTGTNTWSQVTAGAAANSVTLTGLTAGAEYDIRMYASNANGGGRFSPIVKATAKV